MQCMHNAFMSKTTQFTMRLDGDLRASLQAQADAEGRSLANYIHQVLTGCVEQIPATQFKSGPSTILTRADDERARAVRVADKPGELTYVSDDKDVLSGADES